MMFLIPWWKYYQAVLLLCLLLSSEGLNLAASFPSPTEKVSILPIKNSNSSASGPYKTPPLESSEIQTSATSSISSTQSLEVLSSRDSSLKSNDQMNNFSVYTSSYSSTELFDNSTSISNSPIIPVSSSTHHENTFKSHSANLRPSSVLQTKISHVYASNYVSSSFQKIVSSSKSDALFDSNTRSHFHTPLMSLLIATPSSSLQGIEPTLIVSKQSNDPAHSLTTISSDNESANPIHVPVPTDQDHKKLLMLVLRAEDCTRFSKSDFEKMLSKLMAKFGFNDVIPEVSNAKCYSHLNINVTVGGPMPTLRFLPNVDGKSNFTVDVLNRTFRIIKLEKVDFRLDKKTKHSNISSNIITAVAKHESVAYIAVGVSFGLILVICVSVCCIKCCCLRKHQKRYGVPKGSHVRLRPEDYTLTPIPRPTSLYVDYYRGSGTADIYSTTSAGSIASTTPTVEQGVVQPFDTSIVPLEDSSNLPIDSSRDPSVESVPVQSDLKTFNIHRLAGKGFRSVSTDSKEQLNPKGDSRKVEVKPGGVANPTFQRY